MKNGRILMMAVLGTLALSVTSSRGQYSENLAGTFQGTLTGQSLFNSGTSANDGTVSSWVISNPAINGGGFIFIYQLENQGPDDIVGVNFNSFANVSVVSALVYSNVDVNASPLPGSASTGGEYAPTFSLNTVTAGGAATFSGDLAMGATSWFLVLETGATSINGGYALTQDDFQAHGLIYAPDIAVYSVPEPSSAALILLAGSACFYAILRRRRTMDS